MAVAIKGFFDGSGGLGIAAVLIGCVIDAVASDVPGVFDDVVISLVIEEEALHDVAVDGFLLGHSGFGGVIGDLGGVIGCDIPRPGSRYGGSFGLSSVGPGVGAES